TSLAYFPLSFLAATFIYETINRQAVIKKYLIILLITIGSLISILLMALPFLAQHKEIIIPYIHDSFAVACLNTPVYWNGTEFLIGFIYLAAIIISIKIIRKKIFK